MTKYTVDPNSVAIQCVGILSQRLVERYNLICPDRQVKMYPGVIKHIKKNHKEVFNKYYHCIPEIIQKPDYVGQKEQNSLEMYKFLKGNLLVAIKLDPSGYFFLSSFYELNNAEHKIKKRLKSGRIMAYSDT